MVISRRQFLALSGLSVMGAIANSFASTLPWRAPSAMARVIPPPGTPGSVACTGTDLRHLA